MQKNILIKVIQKRITSRFSFQLRRREKILLIIVFLAYQTSWLVAQDSTFLKGVVVNGAGTPIANVSVSIEGSRDIPAVTNEAGEFTVKTSSVNDWLIVAPADIYKLRRIFLNGRTSLKIFLSPKDWPSGDDVVGLPSRQVLRRNMVAGFTDLNTSKIHHTTAISIDQYMQGRVPGLNVVNLSGMPGSGASTTLRGINSLNTNTQPLYVVDGIPLMTHGIFGSNLQGYAYNPLLGINTLDISKTTIVKDPTITMPYGSQGSNGIVFIETLDPSVTQTTIEVDLRTGLSVTPSNLIPQLDAEEHRTLMSEELFSTGKFEEILRKQYPSLYLAPGDDGYINYQHNTNWQNEIFNNAAFTNMNIKVKGGDEIARYGLSFGYIKANGIVKETGYQGYNLRFVSRLNIFTWLKMNAGVSLNYGLSNLKEAASVKETSPILSALAKSPLLNPYQYDINGNRTSILAEVDDIGVSNPLATIYNYKANNGNYDFISTMDFEARLNKNLSAITRLSLTYNVLREDIFQPNHGMEHYYNNEAINVAKTTNDDLRTFFNNTYLSYNKSIGKDQLITSNTGLFIQSNKFELDWGLTKNAHPSDQYRTIADGQNNQREIGGDNRNWNWLSLYESFNYALKDRYLLSLSASLDGSSRVGDNAANTLKINGLPFGFFYSGGVAWRISEETFLKHISWLEDFKLRLTYGKTGNDDIGETTATNYYQAIKFRETVGLYPAVIPNDKLTYETISQLNTGFDIVLLGSRVSFSFDVFQSTTKDMLVFAPAEAYMGYDFRAENAGSMLNKGFEVVTNVRIMDRPKFKWDVQANLSKVQNEVTAMKGGKVVTQIQGAELVNQVGAPANSFYGYIFKGVYATQQQATDENHYNDKHIPYQAGDAIFADLSGPNGTPDGVINSYDKTSIGSPLPDLFTGLTNVFSYNRFSLSTTVYYVTGNKVFNYLRYLNEQMTSLHNQSKTVLNRWQYDGQITDVPRALWNDPIGNSYFSTRWIEDGSYFRIKNITFSYKIPQKFLSFRDGEFYISANNLFTFSKYLGYDPEFAYSYSQTQQGIDYGLIPQVKQFIAGIKLGL